MKKIEAVVRMHKAGDVMRKLSEAGFGNVTATEIHLNDLQDGDWRIYNMQICITVPDEDINRVLRVMMETARTGNPGDGRIAIAAVEHFIDISTGVDAVAARVH